MTRAHIAHLRYLFTQLSKAELVEDFEVLLSGDIEKSDSGYIGKYVVI